ncbi:MAG: hypothetical protein FWB76_00795 [Oscillospiraceae bacterium]|nr:hypothetical protein [Oscillospiraceae bacterium]
MKKFFKEHKRMVIAVSVVIIILMVAVIVPLNVAYPHEQSRDRYWTVLASLIGSAAVVIIFMLENKRHKDEVVKQDEKHRKEKEAQEERHHAEKKEKVRPVFDMGYLSGEKLGEFKGHVPKNWKKNVDYLKETVPNGWSGAEPLKKQRFKSLNCFVLKLLSASFVSECTVKVFVGVDGTPCFEYSLGVLVQGSTWALPLAKQIDLPNEIMEPFRIGITCKTSEAEKITHVIYFDKWLEDSQDIGYRIVTESTRESIFADNKPTAPSYEGQINEWLL